MILRGKQWVFAVLNKKTTQTRRYVFWVAFAASFWLNVPLLRSYFYLVFLTFCLLCFFSGIKPDLQNKLQRILLPTSELSTSSQTKEIIKLTRLQAERWGINFWITLKKEEKRLNRENGKFMCYFFNFTSGFFRKSCYD